MGYFKNLEIDVIDMYREDGLKEEEIAKITGLSLTEVNDILAAYENRDVDYNEYDADIISYDDLTLEPNDNDYNAEHY